MVTTAEVTEALHTVRDPELDESLVELGFVAGVEINGCAVAVRLRLPTYFCAPNFAYLMCADAQSAVGALPGVRAVWIVLDDHHASEEINAGIAARQGFRGTFPGLAEGELDDLRATFRRKAFVARQDLLARALLATGRGAEELAGLRLGDVPNARRRRRTGRDVHSSATTSIPARPCCSTRGASRSPPTPSRLCSLADGRPG